ncbi:hypothetical protein EON78_05295 [bacterium]|nr:MAG: hypothetical protein EON78_05295 [bacterium]
MPEINSSRVLFTNKTYETNSANSQDAASSVRPVNGANDNNSSGEVNRSGNSNPVSKQEPVLDLSRAGTAVLENNSSNMAPVGVNFGDPPARRTSSETTPVVTSNPAPRNYQMTVGAPEFGNSFNISPNLYTSFNNSLSNSTPPKIDHNELEQLGNTATQFGNREDINFVANLRYQGSATVDARSRQDRQVNVTGPDGRPVSFEIDTQAPRPSSSTNSPGININFEEFAQTTFQTVGRSIGPIIIEEYNRQHPASRFTNVQPFTIPPAPAEGFSVSNNSGIDRNNRYNLGVGFQYTQRAFGDTTFNVQANYNTPLFEVPSFLTAGRVGQPYQPGREGLSFTGSVNFGDTGVISLNSETGLRAAANFELGNGTFAAFGYNQEQKNQGGLYFGIGRRF